MRRGFGMRRGLDCSHTLQTLLSTDMASEREQGTLEGVPDNKSDEVPNALGWRLGRCNSAILPRESREAEGRRAVGQGLTSFDAIFLPKGTPAPIIQKLYGTIVAAMNARSGISLKEESEPYPRRKQEETPMTIQDSPSLYGRLGGVPWIYAVFFERSLSQRIVDGAGRYNSAAKARGADRSSART